MKNCQFCQPESFVTQELRSTCSWTIIVSRRPLARGHLIFIPKRHVTDPGKLTAKEARSFFLEVASAAHRVSVCFGSSGWQILMNYGKTAGQSIEHIHFHVIPRYSSEKKNPLWPLVSRNAYKKLEPLSPAEIRAVVKKLRMVSKKPR